MADNAFQLGSIPYTSTRRSSARFTFAAMVSTNAEAMIKRSSPSSGSLTTEYSNSGCTAAN